MNNIRCGKKFRFAVGVQDVEGTAASSPIETMWAGNGQMLWNAEKEEVPGSYGTVARPHYSALRSAIAPTFTATIALTRKIAPLLLRTVYGEGQVSDVVETGDVGGELSSWILKGVIPYYNTDANRKLYADLTNAVSTRKVEIYKDAAKANKVAEGTLVGDGTLSFTEKNNSGISGSVVVAYSDGETDVNLEVRQLKYQKLDNTFTKYLTLWFEDGIKQYKCADCVLRTIRFISTEKSHLRCELEFLAKGEPVEGASAGLSVPSQFDTFCHKKFTLTRDPGDGTSAVTESGDVDGELASWVVNGLVPYTNTDADGKLYVTLSEPVAGDYKVEIFKDSGKAADDKVAEGQRTGNGTISLTEQNDSGISGTVDVTYSDGETAVVLLAEIEFGVREFSASLENEVEVFQGNSLYPIKLIKEAFAMVGGNLKSRYSDETKKLFDSAISEPLSFMRMEGVFSLGTIYLKMNYGKVIFENSAPPAFSESRFDDFDSDFTAYSPDASNDPVVITLDLVAIS